MEADTISGTERRHPRQRLSVDSELEDEPDDDLPPEEIEYIERRRMLNSRMDSPLDKTSKWFRDFTYEPPPAPTKPHPLSRGNVNSTCKKCRSAGYGVHHLDCKTPNLNFGLYFCDMCNMTLTSRGQYNIHVTACWSGLLDSRLTTDNCDHVGGRLARRWTIPVLYSCKMSGCQFTTHLPQILRAHRALCALTRILMPWDSRPHPRMFDRDDYRRIHEDDWRAPAAFLRDIDRIVTYLTSAEGTAALQAIDEGRDAVAPNAPDLEIDGMSPPRHSMFVNGAAMFHTPGWKPRPNEVEKLPGESADGSFTTVKRKCRTTPTSSPPRNPYIEQPQQRSPAVKRRITTDRRHRSPAQEDTRVVRSCQHRRGRYPSPTAHPYRRNSGSPATQRRERRKSRDESTRRRPHESTSQKPVTRSHNKDAVPTKRTKTPSPVHSATSAMGDMKIDPKSSKVPRPNVVREYDTTPDVVFLQGPVYSTTHGRTTGSLTLDTNIDMYFSHGEYLGCSTKFKIYFTGPSVPPSAAPFRAPCVVTLFTNQKPAQVAGLLYLEKEISGVTFFKIVGHKTRTTATFTPLSVPWSGQTPSTLVGPPPGF